MKAIGFLEEAIKIEPDFALAHTLMAGCYTLIGAMGQKDTENLFAKAKTIAQKSLDLDENIGETHIALGSVQYWYEWDIEGARDSCIKALQLSDNLVDSYQLLAMVEMSLKRFDSAVEAINKALRLDPLSLPIHISASFIYLCREEYDEALVYSQRALEYEPNFVAALETKGWVYALQNEFEKALESFNQSPSVISQSPPCLFHIGIFICLYGKS